VVKAAEQNVRRPNGPNDPNDPNVPNVPNDPNDPNDPNVPNDPNGPNDPNVPNGPNAPRYWRLATFLSTAGGRLAGRSSRMPLTTATSYRLPAASRRV
jgi:hypothetical protein